MRKKKVYNRDFESFRCLKTFGNLGALKDFGDCIDGNALISIDEQDIRQLESVAKKQSKDINVSVCQFPGLDPWRSMLSEVLEVHKERDCVMIMSGDYPRSTFLETMQYLSKGLHGGNNAVIYGVVHRPEQEIYRFTCIEF